MKRMKKFMSVLLVGLFAIMCFALTGCGKDLEGTYKFSKLEYEEGGMNVTVKAGEQFMGMMTLSEDYVKITLNEDGTVVMVMQGEIIEGTWEKGDDGEVELTIDGDTQTCKCDGDKLVMEEDGAKITLKK